MIARMKKLTLISSIKGRDEFLLKLRRAGVVHIEHVCAPSSEDITSANEKLSLLDDAARDDIEHASGFARSDAPDASPTRDCHCWSQAGGWNRSLSTWRTRPSPQTCR